jgi:hypothetical protein
VDRPPDDDPILHLPTLAAKVKYLVDGHSSVLDLGCGRGTWTTIVDCPIRVGADLHRPYLEAREGPVSFIPLCLDIRQAAAFFLPETFAVVTLLDVIEHLTKPDGLALLDAAEMIAGRRVVIFTPRGLFPQGRVDFTGLGGEAYQEHQSGWEPEEFLARGYRVLVLLGFHGPEDPAFRAAFPAEDAPRVDALLAWKDKIPRAPPTRPAR